VLIVLIVIGGISSLTKPKATRSTEATITANAKTNTFKMTDMLGEEFTIYLRENPEVLENFDKVESLTGANTSTVSVRFGVAWKNESINRKIYLINSF
jgi:hypothetical protein